MSILRDFEKRLEGAVEGFFARAFRSGLQPVELAKAVQRYAGNYQQVGLDGVIVPNVYRFVIASEDLERFGGYITPLQRELADVVQRTSRERDWQLKGPVRIEFEQGDQVRVGTYELRGKIDSGDGRARAGRADQPAARPARAPAAAAPAAATPAAPAPAAVARAASSGDDSATTVMPTTSSTAVVTVLGGRGETSRIEGSAVVGRLPECDVTLDDPSVSRRHASITSKDGVWTVEDLGSTNGIKVNGERVQTARLEQGDRLELGTVRLTFSLED